MRYTEKGCEDLKICYIGGGSQGWAWKLMSDLYLEEALCGTMVLYDIDQAAARANEQIGNRLSAYPGAKSRWNYVCAETLEQGLEGADFVIISILPASFQEMASDVHAPEQYGIYQSVGDTTGPGGLFRALRTVPMYEVIARAIQKVCPDAWVINYTNPMGICTASLYAVFPQIKAFGCCHEVFGAQRLLLMTLREIAGIQEEDRHALYTNVLGINHFTWINRASYRQLDLMPLYREFVERHYQQGICDKITDPHFMSRNRVKFDLFQKYGVIAAAGDRHLAEFVPEYVFDPETVASWDFMLTPVDWRIENKKQLNELSAAYAAGTKEIPVSPSGEEGVRQMKALLGLGDLITNVNLPNRGQLEGEEHGIVVETNALFTKNAVQPLVAGSLPEGIRLMMRPHMESQKAILQAALNRDTRLAFDAFACEPMIRRLKAEQKRALFDEMFARTREYLPGYAAY